MTIRDLMTPDPATCTPDAGLEEVARMMRDHDTGVIPVVEGGRPVGVVTDRDMVVRLVAEGTCPLESKARDAMSPDVLAVRPGDQLDEAARLMKENQVRRLLVTEDDRLVGVLSQADLARRASDQKVGAIVEEISQPTRKKGA